jgi:hypothetical protein
MGWGQRSATEALRGAGIKCAAMVRRAVSEGIFNIDKGMGFGFRVRS